MQQPATYEIFVQFKKEGGVPTLPHECCYYIWPREMMPVAGMVKVFHGVGEDCEEDCGRAYEQLQPYVALLKVYKNGLPVEGLSWVHEDYEQVVSMETLLVPLVRTTNAQTCLYCGKQFTRWLYNGQSLCVSCMEVMQMMNHNRVALSEAMVKDKWLWPIQVAELIRENGKRDFIRPMGAEWTPGEISNLIGEWGAILQLGSGDALILCGGNGNQKNEIVTRLLQNLDLAPRVAYGPALRMAYADIPRLLLIEEGE